MARGSRHTGTAGGQCDSWAVLTVACTVPTLRPGDQVAVIAPAAQLPAAQVYLLEVGIELLQTWGLRVLTMVSADHHFYLAGTDDDRARRLRDALTSTDIAAVFSMRGGYGSSRLLRKVHDVIPGRDKLLVGFSDVTFLHALATDHWPGVTSLHAPNLATPQLLDDTAEAADNRRSLHAALFDGRFDPSSVEFLHPPNPRVVEIDGEIRGGCLSCLVALLGTPWFPDLPDRILFLEDVREAPFKIDRMLTQLRDSGNLDRLRALVFGDMHRCTDPYNDLREVIRDALEGTALPVAFGVSSGHGLANHVLHLGGHYRLSSLTNTLQPLTAPG